MLEDVIGITSFTQSDASVTQNMVTLCYNITHFFVNIQNITIAKN